MILPGQTIGILGGGQLGRMFAIAARRMGYRVHALDPTQDCPTGQIADVEVNAAYDDLPAAQTFARNVDVVTFEFENIPSQTLEAIAKIKPVHPSPRVLQICRHRLDEKTFLSENRFPVAAYRAVRSETELRDAVKAIGFPSILKTADFGYDGKGQQRLDADSDLGEAWRNMNRPAAVLEQFVRFEKELSVIVARTESGETRCFEPFENQHRNHILDITITPANVPCDVASAATDLATNIANALNLVGILCVEMFLLSDGELVVNELAPRPHNSGHVTFDACVTSQFEQQLRAVCGLPLGDTTVLKPVAMANLLGDLWIHGEPNWAAALADPSIKLHLYGKQQAKPGRKMGHLIATATTTDAAKKAVVAAREALGVTVS